MIILGIDTSLTKTGLARLDVFQEDDGHQLATYSVQVATVSAPGPTKDKSKQAMVRRVNTLMSLIEGAFEDDVDHVAIEALAYAAKGEGAWVLPWIFGRTLELVEARGLPLTVVATTARAKYAAGKGNAPKDQVLASAIKLFPGADIGDNNEADAVIVSAVAAHKLELPILPITQYRLEVMAGLGD